MFANARISRWFWKWHVIAGLITLPIMLILTITGILYLFKDDYNAISYQSTLSVAVGEQHLPYSDLINIATKSAKKPIARVRISEDETLATQFSTAGRHGSGAKVYVNQYTGEVTGSIKSKETLMYIIRKLHGELLLDTPGTLVVELASSWSVVLIITGLYIWFPLKNWSVGGLFSIRTSGSKRLFYRDLHAVIGFWTSAFLLVIIVGVMPWTDVFGAQYKWLTKYTDTDYPTTWRMPVGLESVIDGNPISIDQAVAHAKSFNLPGDLTLRLPKDELGVYSLSNRTLWLSDQQSIHFDQYSSAIVKQHTWKDVGILRELRQVFIRVHLGQYTRANWWILLVVCVLFLVSTIAGFAAYFKRKPQGRWGIPKVPKSFKVEIGLISLIGIMMIVFPVFGISVVAIIIGQIIGYTYKNTTDKSANQT